MKLVIVFACVLLFCFHTYAQADSWTVKAGQEIKEAISFDAIFRYPQFIMGNVLFRDGSNSQALLNFNLLNEEMQFINNNSDTLAIANEATITYITVNTDTFYYSKVFLELVTGNSSVKLAKKQRLKVGDIKKIGAYNQASSSSAISTLNSVSNGVEILKIKPREDVLIVKEIIYYIGDKYNHFAEVNRKNVLKMFGRQETLINDFLKENKIRFTNQADLKTLINFLEKIV